MLCAELLEAVPRDEFRISSAHVQIGAISGALVALCVLFHYEVMSWTSRWLPSTRIPRRARIVVLLLAILLAQVVEVWLFGLTFWALDGRGALGHIAGEFNEGALDFVFFSVTAYSSLGFGDLTPEGPIRILAGTEALLGLTILTWSASITFLEMQRDWGEFRREA